MPLHVAIIVHRGHRFEESNYFLKAISELWRERGIVVSVVRDADAKPEADVAVLHVDLTIVPPEYLALAARYPRCVNGRVGDIRKTVVSRQLVRLGDGYEGAVVVKTDLNSGGTRERRMEGKEAWLPRTLKRVFIGKWAMRTPFHGVEYPVFASPREVPPAVWRNPYLVVERFMPEREGDEFILRTWVFMGDQHTHTKWWSKEPIVKSATARKREPIGEVPEELWARRREAGFDFAKFDYAMVDGRVVLYDTNKTPALGPYTREQYLPRVLHLSKGLDAIAAEVGATVS